MKKWTKIKRYWCQLCFIAFALTSTSSSAMQQVYHVYVVYQENITSHREIVRVLKNNALKERVDGLFFVTLENINTLDTIRASDNVSVLFVPLGTRVTEALVEKNHSHPILSTAIPRLSYELLKERFEQTRSRHESNWFSAIFIDQPLARNLNLIQALLPGARRIGAAIGNENAFLESALRSEINDRRLRLSLGKVTNDAQLIPILNQVLDQSDVFLGIVDPVVLSRTSANKVLQTAYRWRVPLIGISPAYTRAGALGSIYSSPSQIGVHLLETIKKLKTNRSNVPQPSSPLRFSIAINYQVAEALGLQLKSEEQLIEQLRAMEQPKLQELNDD